MTDQVNVFVYGTLKHGNRTRGLDQLCANASCLGSATTVSPAYSLWDLGAFPAVSMQGEDRIRGEVWLVSEQLMLEQLDRIEGYPHFYDRALVSTDLGEAWMYYVHDVQRYTSTRIMGTRGVAEWLEPQYMNSCDTITIP